MSMFSSTFGQLSDALAKEAKGTPAAKPTLSPEALAASYKKRGEKKSTDAEVRYAAFFAEPHTAPEGALKFGIFAQACLVQLYRYEKRGKVRRLPFNRPTGRGSSAILWQWVKEEK